MNDSYAIKVESLSKSYSLGGFDGDTTTHTALSNVSFTLKQGERLGLIGKNGSGKSTLIKIIAGLIKPDDGRVFINNKINSLIEVGSNFIPDLSGKENVKLFLKIQGLESAKIPKTLAKIEAFADIGLYFNQAIKYYSTGMFIRLSLAAGFHIDAKTYVLDEVLMAGDAEFRQKINNYFKEKRKQDLSLILASHNAREIEKNCEKVLWLEKGRVAFLGDVQEGLDQYQDFLAKEQSEKFYYPSAGNFENTYDHFTEIPEKEKENKHLQVKDLTVRGREDKEPSYEDGFTIEMSFKKKDESASIHPLFKIYDVQMNPLLLVISSNDSTASQALNKKDKNLFEILCHFPAGLLSAGTYYLELTAGLNPKIGEVHTKEAYRLKSKLRFQIKSLSFDHTGATQNIFIKPACKWEIE